MAFNQQGESNDNSAPPWRFRFKPSCFVAYDTFGCLLQLRKDFLVNANSSGSSNPSDSPAESTVASSAVAELNKERGNRLEAQLLDQLEATAERGPAGRGPQSEEAEERYHVRRCDTDQRYLPMSLLDHVREYQEATTSTSPAAWLLFQLELTTPPALQQELISGIKNSAARERVRRLVDFRRMFPDLILLSPFSSPESAAEEERSGKRGVLITIIDIKSSKKLKGGHQMQVSYYHRVISHMLETEKEQKQNTTLNVTLDPCGQVWIPTPFQKTDFDNEETIQRNNDGPLLTVKKESFSIRLVSSFLSDFFERALPLVTDIEDTPLSATATATCSSSSVFYANNLPWAFDAACAICAHLPNCKRHAMEHQLTQCIGGIGEDDLRYFPQKFSHVGEDQLMRYVQSAGGAKFGRKWLCGQKKAMESHQVAVYQPPGTEPVLTLPPKLDACIAVYVVLNPFNGAFVYGCAVNGSTGHSVEHHQNQDQSTKHRSQNAEGEGETAVAARSCENAKDEVRFLQNLNSLLEQQQQQHGGDEGDESVVRLLVWDRSQVNGLFELLRRHPTTVQFALREDLSSIDASGRTHPTSKSKKALHLHLLASLVVPLSVVVKELVCMPFPEPTTFVEAFRELLRFGDDDAQEVLGPEERKGGDDGDGKKKPTRGRPKKAVATASSEKEQVAFGCSYVANQHHNGSSSSSCGDDDGRSSHELKSIFRHFIAPCRTIEDCILLLLPNHQEDIDTTTSPKPKLQSTVGRAVCELLLLSLHSAVNMCRVVPVGTAKKSQQQQRPFTGYPTTLKQRRAQPPSHASHITTEKTNHGFSDPSCSSSQQGMHEQEPLLWLLNVLRRTTVFDGCANMTQKRDDQIPHIRVRYAPLPCGQTSSQTSASSSPCGFDMRNLSDVRDLLPRLQLVDPREISRLSVNAPDVISNTSNGNSNSGGAAPVLRCDNPRCTLQGRAVVQIARVRRVATGANQFKIHPGCDNWASASPPATASSSGSDLPPPVHVEAFRVYEKGWSFACPVCGNYNKTEQQRHNADTGGLYNAPDQWQWKALDEHKAFQTAGGMRQCILVACDAPAAATGSSQQEIAAKIDFENFYSDFMPNFDTGTILCDIGKVDVASNTINVIRCTFRAQLNKENKEFFLIHRYVDFNTEKTLAAIDIAQEEVLCNSSTEQQEDEGASSDVTYVTPVLRHMQRANSGTVDKELFSRTTPNGHRFMQWVQGKFTTPAMENFYQHALANPLTLLWGPPGTGKTTTLARSLCRMTRTAKRSLRILIVAFSHQAISVLTQAIAEEFRELEKMVGDDGDDNAQDEEPRDNLCETPPPTKTTASTETTPTPAKKRPGRPKGSGKKQQADAEETTTPTSADSQIPFTCEHRKKGAEGTALVVEGAEDDDALAETHDDVTPQVAAKRISFLSLAALGKAGKKLSKDEFRSYFGNDGQDNDGSTETPQHRRHTIVYGTVWAVYSKLMQQTQKSDSNKTKSGGSSSEIFDVLIIDEGSQMQAAHALIPSLVLKKHQSRVIVAGDLLQLCPIINAQTVAQATDDEKPFVGSILQSLLMVTSQPSPSSQTASQQRRGGWGKPSRRLTLPHEISKHNWTSLCVLDVNYRSVPPVVDLTACLYPEEANLRACDEMVRKMLLQQSEEEGDFATLIADVESKLVVSSPKGAQNNNSHSGSDEEQYEVTRMQMRSAVSRLMPRIRSASIVTLNCSRSVLEAVEQYETEIVCSLVHDLLSLKARNDIAIRSIMVVTPHRAQRDSIRLGIDARVIQPLLANRSDTKQAAASSSPDSLPHITVDTTERMQGSAADVVICALLRVRHSSDFIFNLHRLNVAFSRARYKLICVLNDRTLLPRPSVLSSAEARAAYEHLKRMYEMSEQLEICA